MVATNLYQVKIGSDILFTQNPLVLGSQRVIAKFRIKRKDGKIAVVKESKLTKN